MSTPSDPISDGAIAVQEVAKTTGQVVVAAQEAGGFIARFVAGSLEQAMGIVEDRLRYMRWERQLRLIERTKAELQRLGMTSPTRAVPLKLLIPILQGAAIEEDDQLQNRWINLLVNAANVDSGVDVQRSHMAILEQLSPLEASILDTVYSFPFAETQHAGLITTDLPGSTRIPTKEDKEQEIVEPSDEVKLALGNLARLGCLKVGFTFGGGESFRRVNPTILGRTFVRACRAQ